jgi:hypothetical protein
MEDLWLYLHMMFERIWEYRFLYRNLDDLLTRDPKLKSHFNIIVSHKREAVVGLCRALVEAKAMQADEAEIAALAENILVVASYWLNFEHLRLRAGQVEEPDKHLARGVYQVMSLVAPFLVGEARRHLQYLSTQYAV